MSPAKPTMISALPAPVRWLAAPTLAAGEADRLSITAGGGRIGSSTRRAW